MNSKISIPTPARPKPTRLLLPQFCPVSVPVPGLDSHLLALRATAVTILLADILAQRGYYHGGLNE
jgi:hypothetical protein